MKVHFIYWPNVQINVNSRLINANYSKINHNQKDSYACDGKLTRLVNNSQINNSQINKDRNNNVQLNLLHDM